MMTEEQFERTLRELLQRRPYKPFRVALVGGEVIEIDDPQYVARDGGTAGYINAAGVPFAFDYQNVVEFIPDPAAEIVQ